MNVLEIGIAHGESVKMWQNFFPNSEIYGVDIKTKDFQLRKDFKSSRISELERQDKLIF